ncbi:MAG: response regulator [Bacteroidota bacterium]
MTAIRCDRFFHPDAVLLDVELKGIDGFETLRKLKKLDAGARVLIVTNYDSTLPPQASSGGRGSGVRLQRSTAGFGDRDQVVRSMIIRK